VTSSPPTQTIEVAETSPNHWLGSCGDLVMLFAYEGSHNDTAHVTSGERLIQRLVRRNPAPLRLLFALPVGHAKPPDQRVRDELRRVIGRFEAHFERTSLLVLGTGFGPAVHRGAMTGLLAFVRPKATVKVHASIEDALHFLLGVGHPGHAELHAHCERHLGSSGPARSS
jgi:hypothetical protein